MSLKTNRLRDAICYSLAVGLSAVSVTSIANAQTAPAAAPQDQSAKTLDTIVVTARAFARLTSKLRSQCR